MAFVLPQVHLPTPTPWAAPAWAVQCKQGLLSQSCRVCACKDPAPLGAGERPGLQRGDVAGRCMRPLWDAALGCPAQGGWISPCSAAPSRLPQGPCRAPALLVAPTLPTATLGLLTGLFSAGHWPGRALERPWARSLEPPGPAPRRQRCPSSAHGLSLLQPRHCQPRAGSEPQSTQALQQHEGQEGSGAVAREQHWQHQGLLLLGTAAVPP